MQHRRFAHTDRIPLPLDVTCTLARVEVDDDASSSAAGLHIDPQGDECGELFFEKSAWVDSKLGSESPVYHVAALPSGLHASGRLCRSFDGVPGSSLREICIENCFISPQPDGDEAAQRSREIYEDSAPTSEMVFTHHMLLHAHRGRALNGGRLYHACRCGHHLSMNR